MNAEDAVADPDGADDGSDYSCSDEDCPSKRLSVDDGTDDSRANNSAAFSLDADAGAMARYSTANWRAVALRAAIEAGHERSAKSDVATQYDLTDLTSTAKAASSKPGALASSGRMKHESQEVLLANRVASKRPKLLSGAPAKCFSVASFNSCIVFAARQSANPG
jgi:hypothetical protein